MVLHSDFQGLPLQSWVTPAFMGTPCHIPIGAPTWPCEDKAAIFRGTQL